MNDINKEQNNTENRHKSNTSRLFGGAILIIFGGIFLLQTIFHVNMVQYVWPIALIAIGIAVLFGRR